ncbi:MAG: hypothetical protein WAK91_11290 [Candidatus Acidiferrales bacterium]|jgi:hypothetical protein
MNSPSDSELLRARLFAMKQCVPQTHTGIWRAVAPILLILVAACAARAQTAPPDTPSNTPPAQRDQQPKSSPPAPQTDSKSDSKQQAPAATPPSDESKKDDTAQGEQTNRILGVMPNYRAVSADTILPPLSPGGKFVLATHDSLDYTSGLFAGLLAGWKYSQRSYPEFHSEWAGYSRYLWRAFADQAIGNYFTEAIVPSVLHEDPRYYTLGHGSILHRTEYAITRLVVTKTDSGKLRFNTSEILGNGMAAGVSDLYYPSQERTFTKTTENWGTEVAADGIANVIKEFWPDVRRRFFKPKQPE